MEKITTYRNEMVTEGIIVCVLYIATIFFLILLNKRFWIHEYPKSVRDKYLENETGTLDKEYPGWKKRKNIEYILRLFIKKVVALIIYAAVVIFMASRMEYSDIFCMESFFFSFILWPAITLLEALVLDIIVLAHWKMVRLRGTKEWNGEYKKIVRKMLCDSGLGLVFGVFVHLSLLRITMGSFAIEINRLKAETAKLQQEWEELKKSSSYTASDSEPLDSYLNLKDWLTEDTKPEGDEDGSENEGYTSAWEEEVAEMQDSSNELNEIADVFAELIENIQQVVEYKDENPEAGHINDNRQILRERPVLAGESLWSIAEEVYRDPYKWRDIYEANKDIIGENPAKIYKEQYLILPEDETRNPTDYEYAYQEIVRETGDWEGITEYIAPDCGYEVQNVIFYYTLPEGKGEKFKICYPRLVSLNGKDVSAINEGIRKRAMASADYMMINRPEDFENRLKTDDRYGEEWVCDQVNYVITYLDEDTISVVFQHYLFEGSIYAEYLELRSYVADINTGTRYMTTDLLTNLEDGKLAEAVNKEILLFYEEREQDFQTWVFNDIITADIINQTLQTNSPVEGRYYSNVFLTPDGVGIGLTYRMNKEIDGYSKILRGWKNVIFKKEQISEYLTDVLLTKE